MFSEKSEKLIDELNELDYTNKKLVFDYVFPMGTIGNGDINEIMILFSLTSLTYLKLKEKNRNIRVVDILKKITKKDDEYFNQMLESISIIIENMCFGNVKASNCGLKNSKEIINKIKEILNTWSPF